MSFRKVLFFGAAMILGFAGSARAQLGVYGMYSGERFTGITCPTYATPCGTNSGAVKPYGATLGAFYDFMNVGPVRLGVDVRGDLLRADKRADSSAGGTDVIRQFATLGGIRGTVRTPKRWLRPYAEIAGGYTRNNDVGLYTFTTTTTTFSPQTTPPTAPIIASSISYNPAINTNYFLVKGFVGVDIAIFPFLDLRAIELGEGEGFGTPLTSQSVSNSVVVNGVTGATISTTSVVTGNTHGFGSHGNQSIGAGIVLHLPRPSR
jgi:hypothetical protein